MDRHTYPRQSVVLAAIFVIALCFGDAASAQPGSESHRTESRSDRVAVVVGNGNYAEARLRNPPNDAAHMGKVLRSLGFRVIERINADRETIRAALAELADHLAPGGVALFYFAGHGLQARGRNYLLPVDVRASSEVTIETSALRLSEVLRRLHSNRDQTTLVILDACRDNPFEGSGGSMVSGLAAIDAPSETLIAYATAPGKVAAEGQQQLGLYTGALVEELAVSGLRIEDVFKRVRRRVIEASAGAQVPWESSSLIKQLYLSGEGAGAEEQPLKLAQRQAPVTPRSTDLTEDFVTLGVMSFRSLGTTEHGFRREVLRDALNTQLSQLTYVKVYSKEFLDFLVTRKGLTEIEAAKQLGISKLLSGSLVSIGPVLRIETHVVDVDSGLLDRSFSVSGPDGEFLRLLQEMVLDVVSKLDLPLTEADEQLLYARREIDPALLRLLLEAEGASDIPPDVVPTPTEELPSSLLRRWLARALWAAPVLAQIDADRVAIEETLEAYRNAIESSDVDTVAAVYVEFAGDKRAALEKYFENVRDLRVTINDVDIAVVGDEAVVSYTRTDDFTDERTGRAMHVSVRLTKVLVRVDGIWKLTSGE